MEPIPRVTLNNKVVMPQLGLGVFRMPPGQTTQQVLYAFEQGYRLIDTAAMYGNEDEVGAAVRTTDIPRSELFITTKVWNSEHGYDKALRAFDASLHKLDLDYLDLYLIHWPQPKRNLFVETWKALEQLYKDGRVKTIGVCNFNPEHLDTLLAQATVVPAVLQIELHPTFSQASLRQYAKEHGIQVEAWFPLGGQSNKDNLLSLPLLAELGKKYDKSPAQIVLRWHMQLGVVAIPKSSKPERLKENRDIFDFQLSGEEMAAITALDRGDRLGTDPATFNEG